MRILVTGSNGFIGRHLVKHLCALNHQITCPVRRPHKGRIPDNVTYHTIDDIMDESFWQTLLDKQDIVIHLAGLAHDSKGHHKQEDYLRINYEWTKLLTNMATKQQIRQFIFLSTAHVHGTMSDNALNEYSPRIAHSSYALSKIKAEDTLIEQTSTTKTAFTIIRPCIVYGEGVKANIASLVSYIKKGIPLPILASQNRRSFLSIDTLNDFIEHILLNKKSFNQCFLLTDDEDMSTRVFSEHLAKALHVTPRFFYIPRFVLRIALTMIGKRSMYESLFGSLYYDISHAKATLGWTHPKPFLRAIRQMVSIYRS